MKSGGGDPQTSTSTQQTDGIRRVLPIGHSQTLNFTSLYLHSIFNSATIELWPFGHRSSYIGPHAKKLFLCHTRYWPTHTIVSQVFHYPSPNVMSATKAALKAAKSSLDAGDYETAAQEARKVLSSDSKNYFALLFIGRACEKQGKVEDAAKAYHSAADAKPDDSQAWLGLCSLYKSQGSKNVDEYRECAVKATEIFATAEDRERAQSTVDKLVRFAKDNGTKAQYKRALQVLLPGSPVFDFLEGRIPQPVYTLIQIAQLTEEEEESTIKQEIYARRTRIGARLGQVTSDVKREVYSKSDLEELYREIINWAADDDLRRQYEEKLLQRAYEELIILPLEQKASKLDQVLTLAEGMVIINHPFQLAWNLVLESRDLDDLGDMDVNILREYTTFFAQSGLGNILKAWLGSGLSPFPPIKDEDGKDVQEIISAEDRLLLITEGLAAAEGSPLAHRLVGDYYLHLEEHESAVETSRTGLNTLKAETEKLGMSLQNTRDAIHSVLATALVHFQAPRNHAEARRLFEGILERKPRFTPGFIGLGLIYEENEEYGNAIDFLSEALQEDPSNVRVGTELAWCKALAGDYDHAKQELESYLPQIKAEDPKSRDLRAQVLYRIGTCVWHLDTSKQARKDRNGAYSFFLQAIKTNALFAPAYTSLGVYYADYARDKKRARQCFQKAFELSPAEILAAERLARGFADQSDWEVVEVIAQRVIDTGRARPPPGSKRKGLSWPYSALGVVQMNQLEYQKAITSFLAALRIEPSDYQSYVGLGESYHNSGRYNSALRTFTHALEVVDADKTEIKSKGEVWFARYMLANVHRELGEYDEAIDGLLAVLEERAEEFGVLMSLLQTLVEKAWRCVQTGLYGQGVSSASTAISTALTIAKTTTDAFNLWKAIGDSCFVFSCVGSAEAELPTEAIHSLLSSGDDASMYNELFDIDKVLPESVLGTEAKGEQSKVSQPVLIAILAYKRAIHTASHDIHAQAVAWYNLGWAEHRAFATTDSKSGKKYLRAAVRCFKRAIELEAGNAEFWNALGVVTTTLNPKVAQHAFVRSLHLNELNAKVWTNLGVLYLLQGDHELAHQAFGRAQSTDPDYAHAWVGEGLIALLLGDVKETFSHFTHAFEISDSSSLISKRQYALSTFDHLMAMPSASNDLTALIQPVFALEQLHRQAPQDLPYQHLAALFYERVGNHLAAIEMLTGLCTVAEADYEASESLTALARFALGKSDLARNQLAVGGHEDAAANAETALDLSSDAESSGLDAEARTKLRLSSHLTAGLAFNFLNRSSDAVSMFKTALQESGNNADVICTLVKILWAQGGEEERSVAREQLFECVENHAEHVSAVTLLGAIAALDGDEDTTSAVREDLLTLRTKNGLNTKEQNDIETLLAALASLTAEADTHRDAAELAEAQAAILLDPSHPQAWSELAALSGQPYTADMAVETSQQAVPPAGAMLPEQLAQAFASVGAAGDAQRAIALAPWDARGWESLNQALSE
jgi:superkiller protein 3